MRRSVRPASANTKRSPISGAVAAWGALHERFGKLPFEQVLAPAIELAERGYGVSPVLQQKWAAAVDELRVQPGFEQAFMPRGRAPEIGERFVFADAGRTLRRIAATRGRDFYEGETAAGLAAHAKANGGSMTVADLAAYKPDWVTPISKTYHGYTLHEIPPNGQGIAALMTLGILSNFDLASMDPDSADARHLQIEAMKAAFADVYEHVADVRHMTGVTPAHLLDDAYLKQRAPRRDRARNRHRVPAALRDRAAVAANEVVGVPGGGRDARRVQPVQALVRMIDWKQNPQAACDAPRWKVNRGLSVDVEGAMEADVVAELKRRGHVLESIADPYMDFGSGQFIWRLSDDMEDGYVAASDARRDGCAAGY